MASTIKVNELANNPTKLWDKLKNNKANSKQVKLPIEQYTTNIESPPADGYIRFVCISDTHNQTDDLDPPEGDVLIHAGDFTRSGLPQEVDHFCAFLQRIKHKYKHMVVIAGNHELTFDPLDSDCRKLLSADQREVKPEDMKAKVASVCTFIEDSAVDVMGFKLYGAPWQPEFHGWAYNLPRGESLLHVWNLIPDDTDILITHGPPLGYGDLCSSQLRAGCSELLSTIQQRVKPFLHVFGHIHEAYGVWTDSVTTYVNASTCTLRYEATQAPIVIDLKPKE
jgi:Icc-related predicted phosphoesterase